MSAREEILARIRANLPASAQAGLPELPELDPAGPDRAQAFAARLRQMGGKLLDPGPADDPLAPARSLIGSAGIVCSMVPGLPGNRAPDPAAPAALHDVDLAVFRAVFAVAETGSVALRTQELGVASLGYLAQRLLILVNPLDIVADLHEAYARHEFAQAGYLVLQTGPSATADIEGVLIHGAQGVRSLSVLLG